MPRSNPPVMGRRSGQAPLWCCVRSAGENVRVEINFFGDRLCGRRVVLREFRQKKGKLEMGYKERPRSPPPGSPRLNDHLKRS